MKQYKIIFSSKESENFQMEVLAPESILFSELHQAIQSALEYDPLQMASFFMSDENWSKNEEIALIDMEEKGEALLMEELKLSEKLTTKGQKLLYLFDFFSERFFNMTIEEIEDSSKAKFSIDVKGEVPPQINIDNESIDLLMQDMGAPSAADAIEDFDEDYNDNDISFENIDDLEDF